MFVKDFSKSIHILKTETLNERLPEMHSAKQYVLEDLKRYLSGWKGEKNVKYYLEFLPEKEFYIFHNLRLPFNDKFFQIDYLILSRFFVTILECKNIKGILHFDTNQKQLIRELDGIKEGFPDPISQVKRHKHQLQQWLQLNNFPSLPIEPYVVISNAKSIITGNSQVNKSVFHSYNLVERYEGLAAKYSTEILDKKQLHKLCKLLLKNHTPDNRNILEKYSLSLSDLTTGVQCPACQKFTMIRKKTWICPHCQHLDSNAHEKALKDYFLLVKPDITNREFRDFMHISSVHATSKMLTKLDLPFTGENKGRIYSGEEYI